MIILRNPGEIDLALLKIMGVSVKNCDNPIGHFGTGLKYAIAVLLRHGVDLCMFIGKNRYDFFTEARVFGKHEFQVCQMKGPFDVVDLPFALEYGSGWEPWQAYRELRSNCIDEGGEELTGDPRGDEGCTTFCIGEIDTRAVFLADMELPLLFRGDQVEIYKGRSDFIFYRGIRAKNLHKPSMYTYNVLRECELTEDRSLHYDFEIEYAINQSIAQMADKGIIKSVITADSEFFESTLSMRCNTGVEPKAAFKEAASECAGKMNSRAHDYLLSHTPKAPPTESERRLIMLGELRSFCSEWSLDHIIDTDHIRITGDLISEVE
jgi:hypothetical protein